MKSAAPAIWLIVALAIAGCAPAMNQLVNDAAAQPAPNALPPAPPRAAPPHNYPQVAADYIVRSLPKTTSLRGAQISSLRATYPPQLGDWYACVSFSGAQSGYIAVFFAGGAVLSTRSEVSIDRCAEATGYRLLPRAVPPKPDEESEPEPESTPPPPPSAEQ